MNENLNIFEVCFSTPPMDGEGWRHNRRICIVTDGDAGMVCSFVRRKHSDAMIWQVNHLVNGEKVEVLIKLQGLSSAPEGRVNE